MAHNSKTVLIISKHSGEPSTEGVFDWLLYLGHKPQRFNGDDLERFGSSVSIKCETEYEILIGNKTIELSYDAVWFRRWSDQKSLQMIIELCSEQVKGSLTWSLASCLQDDIRCIARFFLSLIKCKKMLTSPSQIQTNKLLNLRIVKRIGIAVPKFLFTTEKKELLKFYHLCNKNVVLKTLEQPFVQITSSSVRTIFTTLLDDKKLREIPEKFPLTFFQEYIEKQYEIRSFFLNGKFYSMAIFSQKDNQTKVDFRKYNFIHPNRRVPYKLPRMIEEKLEEFMNQIHLTTGSFDIIRSTNGEYVFLEVNPTGQYGMVSEPCNYNLDYEIAKYLSD